MNSAIVIRRMLAATGSALRNLTIHWLADKLDDDSLIGPWRATATTEYSASYSGDGRTPDEALLALRGEIKDAFTKAALDAQETVRELEAAESE